MRKILPLGARFPAEADRSTKIKGRSLKSGFSFRRCGIDWINEWQVYFVSADELKALQAESAHIQIEVLA